MSEYTMDRSRFNLKDGCSVGLSSIYEDNGITITQLQVLELLNQLNDENEKLKNIFKEVAIQLEKDKQYCEVTVSVPCKYYDEFRKLMIGEGDGRFKEIISTQKIVDTKTEKVYEGMVDTEFLDLVNLLVRELDYLREDANKINTILENGGVILTKGQLKEIIEGSGNKWGHYEYL